MKTMTIQRTKSFQESPTASLSPSPRLPYDTAAQDAYMRAQDQLEALPKKVLRHVRTFQRHMQYYNVKAGSWGAYTLPDSPQPGDFPGMQESVANELKKLLDEIIEPKRFEEELKEEILKDEDKRQVSCNLSFAKIAV